MTTQQKHAAATKSNNRSPKVLAPLPASKFRGPLTMDDVVLEAHVLDDGRRLLTKRSAIDLLSPGAEHGNFERYFDRIPNKPADFVLETIEFSIPGTQMTAHGVDAATITRVVSLYMVADEGAVHHTQREIVRRCRGIAAALMGTALEKMIDLATGFETFVTKQKIERTYAAFFADAMREWAHLFPEAFWVEIARLEGVTYVPGVRPQHWGRYVMEFVYRGVDPAIATRLQEVNPEPAHRRNHHQWPSEFGRREAEKQIAVVLALMRDARDMRHFRAKFRFQFRGQSLQYSFDDLAA